jgi:septum formation protein
MKRWTGIIDVGSNEWMIILASASPRRAELLRAAGIEFRTIVANVDETVRPGETPEVYARRVAQAKAHAVEAQAAGRPVLAADTVVVVDQHLLGKPADPDDARRMLRLLSGRAHEVLTAVALLPPDGGSHRDRPEGGSHRDAQPAAGVERTVVEVAPLSDAEIDWYLASGEPLDKAGAYAIQGLASRFIPRISGSYSNVVGLPVALVYQLLKEVGWAYPSR